MAPGTPGRILESLCEQRNMGWQTTGISLLFSGPKSKKLFSGAGYNLLISIGYFHAGNYPTEWWN